MASMATSAPVSSRRSSSSGMADISLLFRSTASWPSTRRWRAAQAQTRCSGAPSLPCAPREVLPSIATMSGSRSRKASTQLVKHSAKSFAGSAFITSLSASCEGTPFPNGRSRRRKSTFWRARRSISQKSSAPAIVPHSTISRISGRGYRTFHACRGSSNPEK